MPSSTVLMSDMVVEVVYALPKKQWLIEVPFREGMTVKEVIEVSGIFEMLPKLTFSAVGIFGRRVSLEEKVQAGDRIELYRPLKCSPQEARRLRAKVGPKAFKRARALRAPAR